MDEAQQRPLPSDDSAQAGCHNGVNDPWARVRCRGARARPLATGRARTPPVSTPARRLRLRRARQRTKIACFQPRGGSGASQRAQVGAARSAAAGATRHDDLEQIVGEALRPGGAAAVPQSARGEPPRPRPGGVTPPAPPATVLCRPRYRPFGAATVLPGGATAAFCPAATAGAATARAPQSQAKKTFPPSRGGGCAARRGARSGPGRGWSG